MFVNRRTALTRKLAISTAAILIASSIAIGFQMSTASAAPKNVFRGCAVGNTFTTYGGTSGKCSPQMKQNAQNYYRTHGFLSKKMDAHTSARMNAVRTLDPRISDALSRSAPKRVR